MDEAERHTKRHTRNPLDGWSANRKSTKNMGIFWGEASCLAWTSQASWPIRCASLRAWGEWMWMRVAVVGLKFFLPRNHWRKGRASYWKLVWGPLCIWVPNLYWFELILLETDTGWWLFQISSFKYPCREEACWGTQCWVTNCQKIWTGLAIIPSFLGYDKPECFGRRLSAHQSMSQWDEVKNILWQSLGVEKKLAEPRFFLRVFGWVPHRIPRDVPRYLSLLCGFMLFVDCRDCQLPSLHRAELRLGNLPLMPWWGLLHRALLQASTWASQIPTNENCLSGWEPWVPCC